METGTIILGIILLAVYFLPTLIAYNRKHKSRAGVALLNLLFGWTLLGWIVCFVWACAGEPAPGDTKTCPACAEIVKAAANVCRFCGHRFDSAPRARGARPAE